MKIVKIKSIPTPFSAENVDTEKCQGLVYNDALFTQCTSDKKVGHYCNKCAKDAVDGIPICRNVDQRLAE